MIEILTERARIIPYVAEHIPVVLEMLLEPDSNKYIAPMKDQSEEFYREKLEVNVAENEANLQYFCAFTKDTNEFIGTFNLNKFKFTGHDQIGLHFCRKFWNKGYGKECCLALLDYAKKERMMEVIHWIFEPEHEVSKKLAVSLGFEPFQNVVDEWCEVSIYRKILHP